MFMNVTRATTLIVGYLNEKYKIILLIKTNINIKQWFNLL